MKLENFMKYLSMGMETNVQSKGGSGIAEFVSAHKDNSLEFKDLKAIKETSGLFMIIKGVMCPEDARLALENHADAIYVSNHGARQLDTTPATIEVLP